VGHADRQPPRGHGSFSAAFVAVHLVLYLAAIGAGVLLAVLGTRMWREARAGTTR
jgi:hypothetical protein